MSTDNYEAVNIDQVDLQILKALKNNAKASYTKIANDVGISESSVRKRLKKMINSGIIRKFTIEYSLAHEITALVSIKVSPRTSARSVSGDVLMIEGVDTVYEVAGKEDIIVVLRVPSVDSLNRCIERIRLVPGVAHTSTTVVLKTLR